ncbi:MAG: formylglycine-generating enzyme family protein [Phycisphaerae bacterium]|nr:formylglycine-generating enzyme family protein [Phycisphaerae bacterium]
MWSRRIMAVLALVAGFALVAGAASVRAGDVDGDGVDDALDVCNNTPAGTAVDAEGRPLGDIDQDCDTDLDDYALFQQGFTGSLAAPDCNENGVPDDLDIAMGTSEDCQSNGVPDECDIAAGTSADLNTNGIPDECEDLPEGMVLIPGGEFEMGNHHYGAGDLDELPVHAVRVDLFYMGVYEVTNQQYCDYLNSAYAQGLIEVISDVVYKAGGSELYCETYSADPHSRIHFSGGTFTITTGKEDHPMVMVSWYGAVAYCNWRSDIHGREACYDLSTWACDFSKNGYRLPTEAEWEYAARGGQHSPYYMFLWGNDIDGSNANYWVSGDPYETEYVRTTPVGYYDGGQTPSGSDMVNGYGLYDMTGNVWEWCNDWYDSEYYSSSPYDNPQGPGSGNFRVRRGASWYDYIAYLRCANRNKNPPSARYCNDGFRVAAGT